MKDTENGIYTITYPGYYESSTITPQDQKQSLESSCGSTTTIEEGSSSLPMDSRRWGLLINVLTAAAVVSFLAVVEFGLIPNVPGGFYCNDPSISHRFTGDTIGPITLLLVTFFVPLIVLWVVEACNVFYHDYPTSKPSQSRTLAGIRLMWRWYREYLIGVVAVLTITDGAKLLVGEPRPHFLDTCQPLEANNCTTGKYVQYFQCTTSTSHSPRHISDSTKSFPSGHTSLSVFTCVFMVWFIQRRVSANIASLLVPWLQCITLAWAMACSFTRITDHRHHWWDVLAGSVLGVAFALFTVTTFCNNFILSSRQVESRTNSGVSSSKESVQVVKNGNRHQSVRRLLSSTSSYAGSISQEEKELQEMPI